MYNRYQYVRVSDTNWQVSATTEKAVFLWSNAALVKSVRLMVVRSLLVTMVVYMVSGSAFADVPQSETEQHGSTSSVVDEAKIKAEGLDFTQVLDGVYVRYGRHEPVSKDSIADIANHGFIIGETAVAVIDPGGSVDIAKRTVAALREITLLPVTHVIVSHVHPDHSLGLAAYVGEGIGTKPIILGHSSLAVTLANNLEFFKEHYTSDVTTDSLLKLVNAGQIRSVNEELIVDLGNRRIEVKSYDNAHSGSDISVYDQKTKVLWASDLLFVERLPAIDGSILGWLDALNQLDQYDTKMVIPGHGPVGDYTSLVQPQVNYLNWVVIRTREALLGGMSLNEFISNDDLLLPSLRAEWTLFDAQHAVNLARSYAELEWE